MRCGLLGRRLGHSYSPAIHAAFGNYTYELFEKEPHELAAFLKSGEFHGLNVTVPYKQAVIPYLDALTETARRTGAVNTVVRRADGTLLGHNSDCYGFSRLIAESGLPVSGKKVLILGSGGASCAARVVLEDLGAVAVTISRSGENNYQNLSRHADAAVIVNATPVGMYPDCGVAPLELSAFSDLEGVIDMIYNPARTALLLDAQKRAPIAVNGLRMLVEQAAQSSAYFTGVAVDAEEVARVYEKIRAESENIVLIGMPGCGKSTVGTRLAEKLGRKFVDTDAEIEKCACCAVAELLPRIGEAAFRRMETEVLRRFGKESGLVIATGGGCVTRTENADLLRQNGRVFFLQRDLRALATDGRPLSVDVRALYDARLPLYESFCDRRVCNDGSIDQTLAQILEEYA